MHFSTAVDSLATLRGDLPHFINKCEHNLSSDFAVLRAILLELCTELRPALERNTARSHALLVPTGDVHTGVPSNRGIPEGAGQPIGAVPVDPEPSHASRVGRNYLHLSQVYQIPMQQANIKAQFEA